MKIQIEPGNKYGDFTVIESVKYTTKGGIEEKKWKCIDNDGKIHFYRATQLKDFVPKATKQKAYLQKVNKLVQSNSHQMGVRKRYYDEYKRNALKRKHDFNLSFNEFNSIIIRKCYYCGGEPTESNRWLKIEHKEQPKLKYNGVDRLTSTIGYTVENTVPCCLKCNLMKNVLEVNEFILHVHNIYKNFEKSSTTIPSGSTSQANGGGKGVSPEKENDIV